jgi:hypothetical protein
MRPCPRAARPWIPARGSGPIPRAIPGNRPEGPKGPARGFAAGGPFFWPKRCALRSASAKGKVLNYPCGLVRRRIRLARPQKEVKESRTPCGSPEGGALWANLLAGSWGRTPWRQPIIFNFHGNVIYC